ncbi:MAG: CoA ester lyase, partial [Rhizobiales bacterium]|nr:CoA ester lyase [Hyphomicrobiales bacterium]
VYDISRASARIEALFFGGVDMAAELRCQNAWQPLLYARSRVVHAAAGAGLDVIDVPFLDLQDPDGMEREAILARDLGFSGKGSIHPKQIPALNAVFTPDEATIARAKRVIEAFEEADTGLVVIDGKLIEKPVLRDMHRILAIAERVSA